MDKTNKIFTEITHAIATIVLLAIIIGLMLYYFDIIQSPKLDQFFSQKITELTVEDLFFMIIFGSFIGSKFFD